MSDSYDDDGDDDFDLRPAHDLLKQAEARGAYINARDQMEYRPQAQSLVYSLIGHSDSNQLLGEYLRKNGYPRLIDVLLSESLNPEKVASLLESLEHALTHSKPLKPILFPGK